MPLVHKGFKAYKAYKVRQDHKERPVHKEMEFGKVYGKKQHSTRREIMSSGMAYLMHSYVHLAAYVYKDNREWTTIGYYCEPLALLVEKAHKESKGHKANLEHKGFKVDHLSKEHGPTPLPTMKGILLHTTKYHTN